MAIFDDKHYDGMDIKDLQTELDKATQEEQLANRYVIIHTTSGQPFALEALGDRLIIQEDKFKTGLECKKCDGDGYLNEECDGCQGKGYYWVADIQQDVPCRFCRVERGTFGLLEGMGKKTCPDCKGKGALVVIPQISERRPTSGVIRSKGPEVSNRLQVGDRVIYAIFAGTAINFKQKGTCRIMHENEIMGKIFGYGDLGEVIK